MKTTWIAIIAVLAALGLQTPALAQAGHDAHQAPPADAKMSCEHHQAVEAALARIQKVVADTKASTDVAILQRALTDVGAEVTKLQEDGKKCEDMMDMMKKMKAQH